MDAKRVREIERLRELLYRAVTFNANNNPGDGRPRAMLADVDRVVDQAISSDAAEYQRGYDAGLAKAEERAARFLRARATIVAHPDAVRVLLDAASDIADAIRAARGE